MDEPKRIHDLPPAGGMGYYSEEQCKSAKQEADKLVAKRKELLQRRDQSHVPVVRADLTANIWDIDRRLSELLSIYDQI